MPKTYIYCLMEESLEVKYVGKANDPKRRFAEHMVNRYDMQVGRWLQARQLSGEHPVWGVLEVCEADTKEELEKAWPEAERRWIAYFKEMSADLLNNTGGGRGRAGYKWTEGQKAAAKEGRGKRPHPLKGKKRSEETKRKISETKRRNALFAEEATVKEMWSEPIDLPALLCANEEVVQRRQHEQLYGQALPTLSESEQTEEARRRATDTSIAEWARQAREKEAEAYAAYDGQIVVLPEDRRKLPITEEARELIRKARAQQVISPETYQKAAEKRRGTSPSPETRAKISQSRKRSIAENGPPTHNSTPEKRAEQSEKMKQNWKNGVFDNMRKPTPEEKAEANRKRSEALKGRVAPNREQANESIRRHGLLREHWNDIAELETLSPEVIGGTPKKYWFKETGQNRRFLSMADGLRYMEEKELA